MSKEFDEMLARMNAATKASEIETARQDGLNRFKAMGLSEGEAINAASLKIPGQPTSPASPSPLTADQQSEQLLAGLSAGEKEFAKSLKLPA